MKQVKFQSFDCVKNKKAQIGNTITWFAAFLIIFFVMLLFMISSFYLAGKKSIKSNNEILLKEGDAVNLDVFEELNYVLDNKFDYEGDNVRILDFILYTDSNADGNADILFKELQKQLDGLCLSYMLEVPEGYVIRQEKDFVDEARALIYSGYNNDKDAWSNWFTVKLPNKGKVTEIKYRRLKVC
jgi:hypothetical protein